MLKLMLLITLIPSIVIADDINIYDSPSETGKVVVEYVKADGSEHRLLMDAKDLDDNYEEIEKWMLNIKSDK